MGWYGLMGMMEEEVRDVHGPRDISKIQPTAFRWLPLFLILLILPLIHLPPHPTTHPPPKLPPPPLIPLPPLAQNALSLPEPQLRAHARRAGGVAQAGGGVA